MASIDEILGEFDGKKETLAIFCSKTKILIEELLQDANIRYQSVQARVKDREKLKQKYLDPQKKYERLEDVTDQVALRVIVYYEDEVDRVATVIKREFQVDPNRSVDKRETEPDKFGYYALNYICKYSEDRARQTEYKKFAGIWCEIQVVSILRHAWSEIEHPWYDLKDAFPVDIKRRFARIAALLEIAESEFLTLKKLQSDYKQSVAVRVEANVPDLPLDAVTLGPFIEQEPLVARIDQLVAEAVGKDLESKLFHGMVEIALKALKLAGLEKLQDVRNSLRKYQRAIPEFSRRCALSVWVDPGSEVAVARGISLFHMGIMLVSAGGTDKARELQQTIPLMLKAAAPARVSVAREVIAKFAE